jgi:uncharacterized protein YidB (DUF937 family)
VLQHQYAHRRPVYQSSIRYSGFLAGGSTVDARHKAKGGAVSTIDTVKEAISTGDTTKLRTQFKEFVGDIDLSTLKERFEVSGLGDKFDSWISKGENIPASAEDIKAALGDRLDHIAGFFGGDKDKAADETAEVLPVMVDRMTPAGTIPSGS